jgi:hypothetical protein
MIFWGCDVAPAEVVLENEVKVFTPGREHKTIYQGLSDEVDKAWSDLYDGQGMCPLPYISFNSPIGGIMKIPKSEASLLPNKTYPIHYEPGYYIAGLDVFHQLHCLVRPPSLLAVT